jgi:hypothetical protein
MIVSGCGSDVASGGSSSSPGGALSSDSSTAAQISLAAATYVVAPSATAELMIYRTGSTAGTASVGYTTVDGSALAGTDYTAASGTLTWQDGDSTPKSVSVAVTGQALGKNFGFTLTSIEGSAGFGAPSAATVEVGSSGSSSGGSGSVTLSWTAPTTNTNGTALTNLAGFQIYYGTSAASMTNKVSINTMGVLDYVVGDLGSGVWYFQVFAVNSNGVQSGPSTTVSTTI